MAELGVDEVLTTTRAVRRRLDLTRPVDPALLRECLEIALQAPTGGNNQDWHFVVVTDPSKRAAIAEIFKQGAVEYTQRPRIKKSTRVRTDAEQEARGRLLSSAGYLLEHLHEVPVLLIACIEGRFDNEDLVVQATAFGSILPAVWSFMLAARARGLGTSWTTVHLQREVDVAKILGVPYDEITQVALVPVAHTIGTAFMAAARRPLDAVVHWGDW